MTAGLQTKAPEGFKRMTPNTCLAFSYLHESCLRAKIQLHPIVRESLHELDDACDLSFKLHSVPRTRLLPFLLPADVIHEKSVSIDTSGKALERLDHDGNPPGPRAEGACSSHAMAKLVAYNARQTSKAELRMEDV